jgi:branched-chain amino acid aminotransferase
VTRLVMIDGRILGPDDAKVSVYDRGFLYGDAVFEVLRTYSGVPFALDEHLRRLERSAERVAIELPVDVATLRSEIEGAVSAARNEESYVRIMVTRGIGPVAIDPDTAGTPLRVVLVEPVAGPKPEAYSRGIAAVTVRTKRTVDETTAVGAKVTNYLANVLALREAKGRGAQEALIVDASGQVVEGATSNVFAVQDGRVVTPPESAGILPGITRSRMMAAAEGLGIEVVQTVLRPEDLYRADEVFITSSIRELLPVVRVDDRVVGGGVPGPISRAIHRAFRASLGLGNGPMPWE